jgi:chromate transporter
MTSSRDLEAIHGVSLAEATRAWARVGAQSFGGPAGQIAVMHKIIVEEKRWISEERFVHALNYCMLLPGPEAQQLATYLGWLLHGTRGGLVAGLSFVLPGFLAVMALSLVYALFLGTGLVGALFFGLKAAVLAIVLGAVVRLGKKILKSRLMVGISAAAFVAIFAFDVPFPLIIAGAAAIGLAGSRLAPERFVGLGGHGATGGQDRNALDEALDAGALPHAVPSWKRTLRVAATWLALWLAPIAVLAVALGAHHYFVEAAIFFSKAAVVTFGGAYAVLAYIAQRAVESYGWLQPGEMLDGLGMAETTPGPLIQVVQFVGFMGGYRAELALDPIVAGILASCLVTWVTFAPCFLWIFAGAPYVEALRQSAWLRAALAAITAAVVGVILNLAVWFASHTLFAELTNVEALGMELRVPVWQTLQPAALVLAAFAAFALLRLKLGIGLVLAICAAAGIGLGLVGVN